MLSYSKTIFSCVAIVGLFSQSPKGIIGDYVAFSISVLVIVAISRYSIRVYIKKLGI